MSKVKFQGEQGEPGDSGYAGDEYISQSPPPELIVVPGPKGADGIKGGKGSIGSMGSKGVSGDRVRTQNSIAYTNCIFCRERTL